MMNETDKPDTNQEQGGQVELFVRRGLVVTGVVSKVEEATYDYADIHDDNWNSMVAIPLLDFVGEEVRIEVTKTTDHTSTSLLLRRALTVLRKCNDSDVFDVVDCDMIKEIEAHLAA